MFAAWAIAAGRRAMPAALESRIECAPDPKTLLGEKWPELRFAIAATPPVDVAACGLGQLEKKLARDTGFAISDHHLEFMGLCRQCQRPVTGGTS